MKSPASSYNLFIHTPHSVYHLKEISTDTPILNLKAKIELRTGIPKECQILQLAGKTLDDDSRLGETDLKSSSVIRLHFSTRAAERLFTTAVDGDFEGLLREGIQKIELAEGSTFMEQARLVNWNKNVGHRALIAVCAACFNGDIQLLSKLIRFSAYETKQVTSCGRSALHIAAARGSIGCVCLLLDNGIDPLVKDIEGKTAEDIAQDFDYTHCKRRIWLYRWSIKPRSTGKRQNGSTAKISTKLPSLDGLKSAKIAQADSIKHPNEEQDATLPRVTSRSRVHRHAGRSQNSYLKDIETDGCLNTTAEEARVQSKKADQNIPKVSEGSDNQVQSQKSTAEEDEELVMLANLARKYGYKIIQNAKEISDDARCFDDNQNEIGFSCEGTKEQQRYPDANCGGNDERDVGSEEKPETWKNRMKSQRQILQTNDTKEILKPTEMYDIEMELDALTRESTQDILIAREHDSKFEGRWPEVAPINANTYSLDTTEKIYESYTAQVGNEIAHMKPMVEGMEKERMFTNDRSISYREEVGNRLGSIVIHSEEKRDVRNEHSTFENWLRRKAQQKKETLKQNSASSNFKEKRQDLSKQAYKRWLQSKRAMFRRASVSTRGSHEKDSIEKQRPKSGLSFETWMKNKEKTKPRSFSIAGEKESHTNIKRVYSCGMTYSEWIESKKKQFKESSAEEKDPIEQIGRKAKVTGIPFKEWVDSKAKQSQIDRVRKENEQMRAEYEKEIEKMARMKNCCVKTFEEWQLEKKFEDRIRKAKEKKMARKASKNNVKFEEDSKLIYNMWLLNKHLNEIQEEEERLTRLREGCEGQKNSKGVKTSSIKKKSL